ncbi:MAG: IS66 family transposase, partial [Candidatus Micrarchaeia archaeon]
MKSVKESNHIHMDESGWKLFALIDKKGNCNSFIWVFVCKDIKVVLFVIWPSRSAAIPCKTLFDMDIEEAKLLESIPFGNKKRITVDKFSSYKKIERFGLVEMSFCWAHQRREFIQAKTKYPKLEKWADTWIEKIAQLYHINNERIKHRPETTSFKKYDKKLRETIDWMSLEINSSTINRQHAHPQQISLMESMKKHWQGLT